jgi:hypothetical protein
MLFYLRLLVNYTTLGYYKSFKIIQKYYTLSYYRLHPKIT